MKWTSLIFISNAQKFWPPVYFGPKMVKTKIRLRLRLRSRRIKKKKSRKELVFKRWEYLRFLLAILHLYGLWKCPGCFYSPSFPRQLIFPPAWVRIRWVKPFLITSSDIRMNFCKKTSCIKLARLNSPEYSGDQVDVSGHLCGQLLLSTAVCSCIITSSTRTRRKCLQSIPDVAFAGVCSWSLLLSSVNIETLKSVNGSKMVHS